MFRNRKREVRLGRSILLQSPWQQVEKKPEQRQVLVVVRLDLHGHLRSHCMWQGHGKGADSPAKTPLSPEPSQYSFHASMLMLRDPEPLLRRPGNSVVPGRCI